MTDPTDLIGSFVIEVGVRQAWPYLTFYCDARVPPTELRLYIESGIKVTPAVPIASGGALSTQWQTLFSLEGLTVDSVEVSEDSGLEVRFATGKSLIVDGEQDEYASQPPWWLGRS